MNVNLNYNVNKTKQNKTNTTQNVLLRCDKNVFHYLFFVVFKTTHTMWCCFESTDTTDTTDTTNPTQTKQKKFCVNTTQD